MHLPTPINPGKVLAQSEPFGSTMDLAPGGPVAAASQTSKVHWWVALALKDAKVHYRRALRAAG